MSLTLVTGGAGFIGRNLVRGLLDAGHDVRVLDILERPAHSGSRDGHPPGLDPRAEFQLGDVRDEHDLARALDGVSLVCHLAATGGFTARISRYIEHNTLATARLLEVLRGRRQRPARILVASSMAVYGEGTARCAAHGRVRPSARATARLEAADFAPHCPHCDAPVTPEPTAEHDAVQPERPYSISKYDQERLVLSLAPEIGIDAGALRYFLTYGPGQSLSNPYTGVISIFANRVANGLAPIVYEDGQQTRDFLFVDDLVAAHLTLLAQGELGGRVYNVGAGRPTAVSTVARAVIAAVGGDLEPELPGSYRLGDVRQIHADTSRLEGLGWRPRVDLDTGIARFVAWFRTQGATGETFAAAERELRAQGLVRPATRARS